MAQRVAPAVVSGVDSAEGEIHKAIDYVQAGVDELSGVVRQRPATSLFCAALAGYVLAAALSLRGR